MAAHRTGQPAHRPAAARWLRIAALAATAGGLAGARLAAFGMPGLERAAAALIACTDGACNSAETCITCPQDCGACTAQPQENPCNNNGVCETAIGETTASCGDCPSTCGDHICAPEEINTCAADCPPSVTCGDRICSAFERFETCPLDCDPGAPPASATRPAFPTAVFTPARTPTRTPTRTLTASPTPTATRTPTPTRTPAPTSTRPPTASPTATPSGTPTRPPGKTPIPTPAPSATSTGEVQTCRLVAAREMDGQVVNALVDQTEGYRPEYWAVCQQPPRKVCLPADPALDVDAEDAAPLRLLDCSAGGTCRSFSAGALIGELRCFESTAENGQPTCAEGCAFARPAAQPFEAPPYALPLLLVLVILGGLALLLVMLVTRRKRAAA